MMRSQTLLAMLLSGLCACSATDTGPTDRQVLITLSGVPMAARTLHATALLMGAKVASQQGLPAEQTQVVLVVPADAGTGTLVIDVTAQRGDGCVVARGQGQIPVENEARLVVPVALLASERPECGGGGMQRYRLTVVREGRGTGEVLSVPPGIQCGTQCSAEFPAGTWVTLTQQPALTSYLARWGGTCAGSGPCAVPMDRDRQVSARFTPTGCGPGDLCWDNPLPQGLPLYDLWGASRDDVWAVGAAGTIVHWDGRAWSAVASPTQVELRGIWGSAANDVWAVGAAGAILRWNGQRWAPLVHGTGVRTTLRGVAGSGPSDVWLVGDGGTILRWDGQRIAVVSSGTSATLHAVFAFAPTAAFAAGGGATMLRFDGQKWAPTAEVTADRSDLLSLWGRSPNSLYAVNYNSVFRYDGTAWSRVAMSNRSLRRIAGADNQVYALSYQEVLSSSDGITFTAMRMPPQALSLNGLWGRDGAGVWAAGYAGALLRCEAGACTLATQGVIGGNALRLWGSGPNDVWALAPGNNLLLRWNGSSWSQESLPALMPGEFLRAIGGSGSEVWLVGSRGLVLRRTGSGWTRVPSMTTNDLQAVWVRFSNEAWVVGSLGTILRWNGTALQPVNTGLMIGSPFFQAVWGNSSEVWVGGAQLLRLRGATWSVEPAVPGTIFALWGLGSEMWAGTSSGVHRWNGSSFSMPLSGIAVTALAGASGSDVWAASGGRLSRWNGTAWTAIDLLPGQPAIYSLWAGGGSLWAGGNDMNMIMRHRP
jgi:hypothetical protein